MTAADHCLMIAYLAGVLCVSVAAARAASRARQHADRATRLATQADRSKLKAEAEAEAATIEAAAATAAARLARRMVGDHARRLVDGGCTRATPRAVTDPNAITIDSGAGLRLADIDDDTE